MGPGGILLDTKGHAVSHLEIVAKIKAFEESYCEATREVIDLSRALDLDGTVFTQCASRILSSFGMTRSGPFHGDYQEKLRGCWNAIGGSLMEINRSVRESGLPRDRYLLELGEREREGLIAEIWLLTKKLLPFTMGGTTYGLVGASKILFSVLPEIVLPVDNTEWLHVFKTVDLGDVLRYMVLDIQKWEESSGRHLNDLDPSRKLTTLPAIYNVLAMAARPQVVKERI